MGEQRGDLAPMKAQVYKDPRPKAYFDRFHERSRTREPDLMYELVHLSTALWSWGFFRLRSLAADKVPSSGPVILAPNHFSHMDHFFLGAAVRRKIRFMAKSQMFTRPLQFVYTHGGVFPVRRGYGDEEAFVTAKSVIARDGVLAMYCEGGRSRTGDLAERAKPGIGKLALETGATVVPVAIHGSSHVRNWKRLQFPKVTVQYGEPFRFERVDAPDRGQQQVVADEIFGEIKTLYAGLERLGRAGAAKALRSERRSARQSRRAARPA